MKTVWRSILLALLSATACSASNRILISAELDTVTHTISGWVTVAWPALEAPLSDLEFRLYANMRVDKFGPLPQNRPSDSSFTNVDTLMWGDVNLTGQAKADGTDLYCPIERTFAQGESLTVRLHFITHVGALYGGVDRLFEAGGEYLLDGWFPMPAPRHEGHWNRVAYGGLAELVADFYDFDVRFTAPKSLGVIGAGLVSADTTNGQVTHSFSLPRAHDFALYLSPMIESRRFEHGSVTINIYTSKRATYVADSMAEVCKQTLDTMGQWVAPYPFSELHVVVCGLGFLGGIELPRMIVCSEPSAGQFIEFKDVVLIHEVVHQWFYGIINSNQAETPWMDEAIGDYFTERVARTIYGETNFLDWWGMTLSYASLQRLQGISSFDRLPITMPAEQYFSMSAYAATVYNKGAVTLRTLFRNMRSDDESSFWHRYYERFSFATPGESDFIDLLSEYEPYVGNNTASQILHTTLAVDYVIERISNEPVRELAPAADSASGKSERGDQFRNTVEYTMYNPINLPVTMRLTFADGSHRDSVLIPIPGQAKLTLVSSRPLVSAAIDPDVRIGLDKNLLNNSLSLGSNGTGLRLFSGITFLVESLFSYVWGM